MEGKERVVLILDDDPFEADEISRVIRTISGCTTKNYPSIPAFRRGKNVGNRLLEVLGGYYAIVVDHSFEEGDHEIYNDGWERGGDFLVNEVGPALETLDSEDRPLVIFTTRSQRALEEYQVKLEKYEIMSLRKPNRIVLGALAMRIGIEYGTAPLGLDGILRILGGEIDGVDRPCLHIANLVKEFCDTKERFGDGLNLTWKEIVSIFAKRFNLTEKMFNQRVEAEVSTVRYEEGRLIGVEKI